VKKFLLVFIILILILAGLFGLALFNANNLIAQFKPQLERAASELAGAQIQLNEISASILPQTALKVSGLTVKNTSGDGEDIAGPEFKEFLLKLNLRELLSGRLNITEISLIDPKITIIKSASGIRLKGFALKKTSSIPPAIQSSETNSEDLRKISGPKTTNNNSDLPLAVNLEALSVVDGELIFEDQSTSQSYTITNLNLDGHINLIGDAITASKVTLSGLVLDKFKLQVVAPKLSLAGKELSVDSFTASLAEMMLEGSAALNLKSMRGKVSANSKAISLNTLPELFSHFAPELQQYGLEGLVTPNFNIALLGPGKFSVNGVIELSKLSASHSNFKINDLSGTLNLIADGVADALVKTENLRLLLNGEKIDVKFLAKMLGKNFGIENLLLNALGGSVAGKWNLQLQEPKTFSAQLRGGGIDIDKAISLFRLEKTQISGTIENFSSSLSGSLGARLKESLRGNVDAKLSNGEIEGFNLAGMVLKAVNNLPFLNSALYSSVPDSERAGIDSSNTAFSSLDSALLFEGSGMKVNSLRLQAPVFELEADGTIDFNKELDLSSTVFFDKDFSTALSGRIPQLRNVLDDGGRLVIPLKLQGKAPRLLVYPNLKKLMEVAGKRVVVDHAKNVVKDVLEKKGLGNLGNLLGF